jgi:RNA polymerase sigma-70 factor (sigma-E family)
MDAPAVCRLEFADYVAAQRLTLLRAAAAITGDVNTAEDLLQSALANVFVRWAGIRDHRAADAYVRRAMVNQHASWFRQKWRHQEEITDEVPEPTGRWAEPPIDAPSERQQLWPLVRSLPAGQRAAVVLRYYEELSEAETARVLGCSVGTVKSSTSRGLATLRRLAVEPESMALAV